VVPGARGDDHHGRIVPGDDASDERLGTVAARHADDVCSAGERGFGQLR